MPSSWSSSFPAVSSLMVFIFLFFHVDPCSARFDPSRPYRTENFDPAEADPRGNMSCFGSGYAVKLPMVGDFNPNLVSMQQLCVKPQYNGGQPNQHVGGWCSPTYSHRQRFRRKVVFDQSPGARTNAVLSHPRVLLGCLLRCYCHVGSSALTTQPLNTNFDLEHNYQQSTATYEIKIDVVDDFNVPVEEHGGTLSSEWVSTVPVMLQTEVSGGPQHGAIPTSQDAENDIECRGSLPSFPLPSPYLASSFRNLQALCATTFNGGNLCVDY